MSYVRLSTKVVQPCPVCHDGGWVALLPEYPHFLTWRGHTEGGDRYAPMPTCCTSCWYIYEGAAGLVLHHAGSHVCSGPNGETFESAVLLDEGAANDWSPPEWCRHREVAIRCVREWVEDLAE